MFQKIDVAKFGLFCDYKWIQNIGNSPLDIFQRVNIIYGRNYSGKTTLSRIFRCIEEQKLHPNYLDAQFSITETNGNPITQSKYDCDGNIRVYNTDFVKENLGWLHDDVNGDIKPFTLLGSGNIEAEKRIKAIDAELGSIEKTSGLLYKQYQDKIALEKERNALKAKEDELSKLLTNKANNEIKRNNYFVTQGTTYNISNIQREVDEILSSTTKYTISENDKAKHKKIVDETEKANIKELYVTKPKLSDRIKNVRDIIEKKITLTNTIQELVTETLLQAWVNQGRVLHRGKKDTCAFCGNNINPERWATLDAHFSKESEELKKNIEEENEELRRSKDALSGFLESKGIIKDNYYSAYQQDFDSIKTQWDEVIGKYLNLIIFLETKLQERYGDIFNPKVLGDVKDISDEVVTVIELFNKLSKDNNAKTVTLGEDKENSRKVLRYSEIASFLSTIEYIGRINANKEELKRIVGKAAEYEIFTKSISLLTEEKIQKELEQNDEGEAAKKINSHLNNFFGHDGLMLDPETVEGDEPKVKFVIKRGSEKAKNLSEGECSLIAFCYFIAKMEDELKGVDAEKLIIYIDDPISSLDNNHIFFMFSLIESVICKNKQYGQLFISTHNLDFLKYIKRLTTPFDSNNKALVSHFIVEKKKKDTNAKCCLRLMPAYLRDYVTEYNFLFQEIYNMAKPVSGEKNKVYENNFTHLYNLPNNMRKFLECYLFYRFPNTDNPINNISKLFDNNIPSLINRVINEYSHLTWGDRGTLVVDVIEAETVAKEILKAVRSKDINHFDALCESVGADKNIVL